jgi:hypothetical protein
MVGRGSMSPIKRNRRPDGRGFDGGVSDMVF